MTRPTAHHASTLASLPPRQRTVLESQLQSGEKVVAVVATDLDHRLRFAVEWLVLTNQRLLTARTAESIGTSLSEAGGGSGNEWQSWPLTPDLTIRTSESGGVGLLELAGAKQRLAIWRYTTDRVAALHPFAQQVRQALPRSAASGNAVGLGTSICPNCGAVVGADGICASCSPTLQPPPRQALYRLARFARPRARLIALGAVLLLASTAAGLVPPYIVGPFYDEVLDPLDAKQTVPMSLVAWYLGWLTGAAVLAWWLGWARNYVLYLASERISADLRLETYAHLQKLSLEFFGGQRTGDLISRVSSDTDRICSFLSADALDFITDSLLILCTAAILVWINPTLALVTLAPLAPIAWLVQRLRGRLRHGFARGTTAWGDMVSVLADTIPGIRVVKAFAQESREVERFASSNQHVLDANNRVNRLWSFFGPLVTFLTECGSLVIWACGVWLILRGEVNVAVLLQFVAYIGRFYTRLESMSRILASVQRAGAAAHRIFEILDRSPSVPEPVDPIAPGRVRGDIKLAGVRFKYGKREVIHGIDLEIRAGEMIGLVGASGAGKSTLVNLVCRFYDVGQGAILVDGVDIRRFPVEQYRRNIGMVLQEPFLFYGTIAENIAYGRPDATREEIVAAARAAHAHEFILRLADGYDSLVGERGQALSGGERQRISIARALLTDPRILILDEATSAVDTQTEREIQGALDTLVQGRTTIAIAHRLSTLRKADRIAVVEAGKIVEIGPHEQLLAREGAYFRLHQAQMKLAQQIGIG
ncbi:MAG: ABC transporter ATP-binding protein [Pirellulales bacterium]